MWPGVRAASAHALLVGAVVMAGAGCQSGAVPLATRSPAMASVVQPWGNTEIQRRSSFVLPREAKLTAVVLAEGHAPQETRVLAHFRSILPQYFGPQDIAPEPLMADEAIERARRQEADFLLTIQLHRWPGGFVDPAASSCPERREDECDVASVDPDMKLALQVYDVVNQRVVDLMIVDATLGMQSWVFDDVSPLIIDTLSRMVEALAP